MTGNLRVVWTFSAIGLVVLGLIPLQLLAFALRRTGLADVTFFAPLMFHRAVLFLCGVRLTIKGKLSKERPMLIVANHVSWLDIPVIGALGPLSFVAKHEMASWPVLGWLAKLQRTVFVKREARRSSPDQANEIADRMTAREVMVLFPEGTTTDGNGLLPFKTTLFEAIKIALLKSPVDTAVVQPVAIDYSHLHGLPLGRAERPHVAWPGEVGLAESLIPLLRRGALDVTLHVAPPIVFSENADRKQIAAAATKAIRSMLDSSSNDG